MKIYFAGSIRGGRDDQQIYFDIIKKLSEYAQVLTEHVGDKELTDEGQHQMTDVEIYERDMAWLRESDAVVAEVTSVSMGVGYELGQAEAMGKKIICLYRQSPDKRLSAMISGNKRMKIITYEKLEDLVQIFDQELKVFDLSAVSA